MNALLLIDIQNDFCPGGSLAVPEGDLVVPVANELRAQFELVVFTKDWHPANHASFAANNPGTKVGQTILLNGVSQILWPVHCVQNGKGAEFHPDLKVEPSDTVFLKGTDTLVDSYSAFFDNARKKSTGLSDFLKNRSVKEITVCGLATDYCVKYSVLDALSLGFSVRVVQAGCRGIDANSGDVRRAFLEMQNSGASLR